MIEQEQTSIGLVEAIDVENCGFTYIETDEPIPIFDEESKSTINKEELNNE